VEPTVIVLLAEDDALIGLALQVALEEGGYAVKHVSSGAEAMAAVDEPEIALAAIVTDIKLGAGADGWDVARHAREAIPAIPIVYMSGDSAHEHSARGVPDSVMLQKPFAPAQVVTAVSTLLNAVPPQQPA